MSSIHQQAFELCVSFLKHSVIRGDSVEQIAKGMAGMACSSDWVQVGGYIAPVGWRYPKKMNKLPPNSIGVEKVNGVECCEVFSIQEVKEEIEKRWIPETAKIRNSRG